MLHSTIESVTDRIHERSRDSRKRYLDKVDTASQQEVSRKRLSCGNIAHAMAACNDEGKSLLASDRAANLGIVSAYNEMLSAHQPYVDFPDIIKRAARDANAVAQFAGGVPAMCDGVTQGRDGMELSLFSRDVIAMATGVALSHDMFDGVLCLGVCDKIVPGLLIGALSFGHLPPVFIPAGPMHSGLPCTFYGTANSNQMLMEIMGLHLPGSSFINPGTEMRDALTAAAVKQLAKITKQGDAFTPLADIVNERSLVNAIVGLLATGGSTNHAIHLIAIARAAGILINSVASIRMARRT